MIMASHQYYSQIKHDETNLLFIINRVKLEHKGMSEKFSFLISIVNNQLLTFKHISEFAY